MASSFKSLVVCLFLIIALGDATQLFSPRIRHGRKSAKILEADAQENVDLPQPFNNPTFPAPRLDASAKATYNFAVDLVDYGSSSTFGCIYKQGYNAAFIQAYSPASGGSVNTNLIQNLNNAAAASLGNEIYVTPTMSKQGQTQFDAVFNKLKSSGIQIRSIWLQVTSPIIWNTNIQTNVNLIQSFVNRANKNGVSVGIYTSWYDWQQITGSYNGFSGLRLWYWNSLGQGPNAESSATFDDFRAFAGWGKPAVKQFALNEGLCGLTLNRNIYPLGSKSLAAETNNSKNVDKKLTVGGFV